MAAKKTNGPLAVGTRIVVREGVHSPDFPEITFGGWTGTIAESAGTTGATRFLVEWDDATCAAMPADYTRKCEEQCLYARMAWLDQDQVEAA